MDISRSGHIVPVLFEDEMRSAYLDYAMSVIVSRALPDVRDGLKPVQRRILYAMNELGLLPNRPYRKSARIVGEVLGKYHPHGDASVYDAMVRMAQEWTLRYPLIDGQGNFGSIDDDAPAAMRYTEARLAPIALEVLRDIEKNTVDFRPNFDESLQEPKVLPTAVPLLLVNGAEGIAVGMSTKIPPHNLREIVAALQALITNPSISDEELLQYVKAPDFPTGGIIYGYEGVREAYLTGRGSIQVRARATIEVAKSGKESIIITEIPFGVTKASLIEKIAELVRNKALDGITDIRDESDRDGIRIVLELRRDAIPRVILNNLYKKTQLQTTFAANMIALVGGRPKLLTLRELLEQFLLFRNEVVVRRTQYELEQAERRAHILEGFIIALDNIDAVIETIKRSETPDIASVRLQERFGLTEIQAKAILDMRLQRLTGLEREKIQQEYRELIKTIERLRAILASKELQLQVISEELRHIAEKFGDERRTDVVFDAREFTIEDMIANEDVIVTISRRGMIKRTPLSSFRRQSRGGKGLSGASTYDDDFVQHLLRASTHDYLLFFTDRGRVFRIKVYDIPEGGRTAKGRSIANIVNVEAGERITAHLLVQGDFSPDKYIFMCTRHGVVKKTVLSEFESVRSSGKIAITLEPGDVLLDARLTDGTCDIIIGTHRGMACRFRESDVRPMGRTAAGVRGIKLEDDDFVVSMTAIKHSDTQVVVVSERGYGKRTRYQDFRLTRRGAKGVISMNITEKTGNVVALLEITDDDDLVVITKSGRLIRQPARDIRLIGRNTQGVRLIRLEEGEEIADIAVAPPDNGPDNGGDSEAGDRLSPSDGASSEGLPSYQLN
ncbi:MAG: DNA gyrase subunit A [Bacteroidota bacterium]|nr:DNA gyrase subunit A [Candidatus Kapabacteria bacterium]MCS7303294.1 DNA gyrase subunit A [Candidatus Kapabacteria bacterium]MCX7937601.1 DNA gyrase subunit A [Chlorobiota bacterium]MDW8074729.1 DNA gyrase subunit A [Bacteroidota bacterium]MDW8270795.1 DNA gyrase subunit A [Bacteroidota bacterium]